MFRPHGGQINFRGKTIVRTKQLNLMNAMKRLLPGALLVQATLLALLLLFATPALSQPVPVIVGLSKASTNYVKWLKAVDSSVVTIDLADLRPEEVAAALSNCDGLVLTGGEDVFPGRYGKAFDTVRCTEMDPRRDTLEFALLTEALRLKMPVMGICRGHQLINVFLGGTLIVDIPSDVQDRVPHQCDDYLSCFHPVLTEKGSTLATLCGCDSALVTTNHHQAVDKLAPGLKVSAYSPGRIVEAVEWRDPSGKSFLLGVQWHPERMDLRNPLSGPLALEFLQRAALYSTGQ